jgi:hypothetical protein
MQIDISGGNIMDNKYYVLWFWIGTIEESKKCPNCIEYNADDIVGVKTSVNVGSVNINDITTLILYMEN